MWDNSAVVNSGNDLLAQWVSGKKLIIDKAAGGTGTVPAAAVLAQTNLLSKKQDITVVAFRKVDKGVRVSLHITNEYVTTDYMLNQIGIWAHLENEPEIFTALYQDDVGILIPANSGIVDFSLTFYALITMNNTGQWEVIVDTSALISKALLDDAIEDHNQDPDAHDHIFAPYGYGLGQESNLITNTDLNTLIKNGWYSISSGCTNLPKAVGGYLVPTDSAPGMLRVETSGANVYQWFYPYTQVFVYHSDATTMTGYFRVQTGGNWESWSCVAGVTGFSIPGSNNISTLYQPGCFNLNITTTSALNQLPAGARMGRYCILNTNVGGNRILQQAFMIDESGQQNEGNLYFRTLDDNQAVNPVWRPWTTLVTSSSIANKIIPEITSGTSAVNRKITLDGITSYDQLYDIELTVASAYLDFNGGLAVTFEVNSLGAVPVYFLDPNGGIGNQSVAFWATNGSPYKITYRKISSSLSVFYVYATPYVRATENRYGFVKTTSTIDAQTDGGLVPDVDAVRNSLNGAGGTVRQDTPPSNTRMTWIDSSDGDKPKYFNGTEWKTFVAVWG